MLALSMHDGRTSPRSEVAVTGTVLLSRNSLVAIGDRDDRTETDRSSPLSSVGTLSVLDGGKKREEQHALYTRTQNTH